MPSPPCERLVRIIQVLLIFFFIFFFYSQPLCSWESYPELSENICFCFWVHAAEHDWCIAEPCRSSWGLLQDHHRVLFTSRIWRSCFLRLGLTSGSCLLFPEMQEKTMCLCEVVCPRRKTLGVSYHWRNYSYCSGSLQAGCEPCLFLSIFKMTTVLARHYLNSRQLWKHLARKHVRDNKAIAIFGCHKADCLKILPRKFWGENVTCGAPDYFIRDINIFVGYDYHFSHATDSALNRYKGKNKLSCPDLVTVKKHALFPEAKAVEWSTLRNMTPSI